jgi:MtN3 and saliva related transmembrane protein
VVRTWRTKQTEALSVGTFVLIITAGVAWVTYGVLEGDKPVILTNVGMVALNGAILAAKLRYK